MNTAVVEFCRKVYERKDFEKLIAQYIKIDTFYCLLLKENRETLLKMFGAVYDQHASILHELEMSLYENYIETALQKEETLKICVEVGEFLIQYGYFENAIKFLRIPVSYLSENADDENEIRLSLKIFQKLLHIDAILFRFKQQSYLLDIFYESDIVSNSDFKCKQLLLICEKKFKNRETMEVTCNLATINSNYSVLYFAMGRYDLAYKYSMLSIKSLKKDEDMHVVIKVLSHASKTCIVNQLFTQGKNLIDQAMSRANKNYTQLNINLKFAEVLLDYAFFIRKFGNYKESKETYNAALTIYKTVFGRKNLYIALAEIELAEVLLESGPIDGNAMKLIEDAITYLEKTLAREDKKMMLLKAYLIKASMLLKIFKSKETHKPFEKLNRVKMFLNKIERTILETFGATSFLYTKYLIVLTNIYFAIGNYREAFKKSKSILGKKPGYFSVLRNLHEPLVKAQMACDIIYWCNATDYRDEVIEAIRILESSIALITNYVKNDNCRELGKFYQSLTDAHKKIIDDEPANFENKYHVYQYKLLDWKQDWLDNYHANFTKISGIIYKIETLVDWCKEWKSTV